MTVKEYSNKVNKTVEKILNLCKKIGIKVSKGNSVLTDDDIALLDYELEEEEKQNSGSGGGDSSTCSGGYGDIDIDFECLATGSAKLNNFVSADGSLSVLMSSLTGIGDGDKKEIEGIDSENLTISNDYTNSCFNCCSSLAKKVEDIKARYEKNNANIALLFAYYDGDFTIDGSDTLDAGKLNNFAKVKNLSVKDAAGVLGALLKNGEFIYDDTSTGYKKYDMSNLSTFISGLGITGISEINDFISNASKYNADLDNLNKIASDQGYDNWKSYKSDLDKNARAQGYKNYDDYLEQRDKMAQNEGYENYEQMQDEYSNYVLKENGYDDIGQLQDDYASLDSDRSQYASELSELSSDSSLGNKSLLDGGYENAIKDGTSFDDYSKTVNVGYKYTDSAGNTYFVRGKSDVPRIYEPTFVSYYDLYYGTDTYVEAQNFYDNVDINSMTSGNNSDLVLALGADVALGMGIPFKNSNNSSTDDFIINTNFAAKDANNKIDVFKKNNQDLEVKIASVDTLTYVIENSIGMNEYFQYKSEDYSSNVLVDAVSLNNDYDKFMNKMMNQAIIGDSVDSNNSMSCGYVILNDDEDIEMFTRLVSNGVISSKNAYKSSIIGDEITLIVPDKNVELVVKIKDNRKIEEVFETKNNGLLIDKEQIINSGGDTTYINLGNDILNIVRGGDNYYEIGNWLKNYAPVLKSSDPGITTEKISENEFLNLSFDTDKAKEFNLFKSTINSDVNFVYASRDESLFILKEISDGSKDFFAEGDQVYCIVDGKTVKVKSKDNLLSIYLREKNIEENTSISLADAYNTEFAKFDIDINYLDNYNYVYNTKGSKDAFDYFLNVLPDIDERAVSIQKAKDCDFADRNPEIASINSIVIAPFEGYDTFNYVLNRTIKGQPVYRVNTYSSGDTMRNQVSSNLYNSGSATASINGFLYNTGMSMADNLYGSRFGPFGVGLALFGGSFDNSFNEALDRGIDSSKALVYATSMGVLEGLTEQLSFNSFLKVTGFGNSDTILMDAFSDKVSQILGSKGINDIFTLSTLNSVAGTVFQASAEGFEELVSSVGGRWIDNYLNGSLSSQNLRYVELINNGCTPVEASNIIFVENIKEDAMSVLSGMVSGGFMAGPSTVISNFSDKGVYKNTLTYAIANDDYNLLFNAIYNESGSPLDVKNTVARITLDSLLVSNQINNDTKVEIEKIIADYNKVETIDTENLDLLGEMQVKLDSVGIVDTGEMSLDDIKLKYPDVYEEVVNAYNDKKVEDVKDTKIELEDNNLVELTNDGDVVENEKISSKDVFELHNLVEGISKQYSDPQERSAILAELIVENEMYGENSNKMALISMLQNLKTEGIDVSFDQGILSSLVSGIGLGGISNQHLLTLINLSQNGIPVTMDLIKKDALISDEVLIGIDANARLFKALMDYLDSILNKIRNSYGLSSNSSLSNKHIDYYIKNYMKRNSSKSDGNINISETTSNVFAGKITSKIKSDFEMIDDSLKDNIAKFLNKDSKDITVEDYKRYLDVNKVLKKLFKHVSKGFDINDEKFLFGISDKSEIDNNILKKTIYESVKNGSSLVDIITKIIGNNQELVSEIGLYTLIDAMNQYAYKYLEDNNISLEKGKLPIEMLAAKDPEFYDGAYEDFAYVLEESLTAADDSYSLATGKLVNIVKKIKGSLLGYNDGMEGRIPHSIKTKDSAIRKVYNDWVFDLENNGYRLNDIKNPKNDSGEYVLVGINENNKGQIFTINRDGLVIDSDGNVVSNYTFKLEKYIPNDLLRYTIVSDGKNYVSTVASTLIGLEKQGIKILKAKFSWPGSFYQGINLTLQIGNQNFELQIHTNESFYAKDDATHMFYEIVRNKIFNDGDNRSSVQKNADYAQALMQMQVEVPQNAEKFKLISTFIEVAIGINKNISSNKMNEIMGFLNNLENKGLDKNSQKRLIGEFIESIAGNEEFSLGNFLVDYFELTENDMMSFMDKYAISISNDGTISPDIQKIFIDDFLASGLSLREIFQIDWISEYYNESNIMSFFDGMSNLDIFKILFKGDNLSFIIEKFGKNGSNLLINLINQGNVNVLYNSVISSESYFSGMSNKQALFNLIKLFNQLKGLGIDFSSINMDSSLTNFYELYNSKGIINDDATMKFVEFILFDKSSLVVEGKDVSIADQGSVRKAFKDFKLSLAERIEQKKLQNRLINQVVENFTVDRVQLVSKKEAVEFLQRLDLGINNGGTDGLCSYADVAKLIFEMFDGKEIEFEEKFGFSMYNDGRLNQEQLIVDLFTKINHYEYIKKIANDTNFDDSKAKVLASAAVNEKCYNVDIIYDYLVNKVGLDIDKSQLVPRNIYSNFKSNGIKLTEQEIRYDSNEALSMVNAAINNGEHVSISCRVATRNKYGIRVNSSNELYAPIFELIDINGNVKKIDSNHIMPIRGIDANGRLVVETWDQLFYVDIEYALSKGMQFSINSVCVNGKSVVPNSTEVLEVVVEQKNFDDDEFFTYLSNGNGKYGVDQGLFSDLRKRNNPMYLEMKNKLINQYGFSPRDAIKVMKNLDVIGACNYACQVNVIVSYFKNMPDKFEQIFGFSLYKYDSNGRVYLNDAEILLDLYFWGNFSSSDAELFITDNFGRTVFNKNAIEYRFGRFGRIVSYHQRGSSNADQDLFNEYLKSKSEQLSCVITSISIDSIVSNKKYYEEVGLTLALGSCPADNKSIVFEEIDTGIKYSSSGGHWTKITGILEDGFIVSSWGKRCIVKFDDLRSNYHDIYFINFNNNKDNILESIIHKADDSPLIDKNMYASKGDLINVNNNQLSASVNSFVKLDGRAVINRILFTKESVNELFGSINESRYYSSQYSKEEVLFGLVKVFNEDSYYVSLFAENNPIASEFISLYYENKSSLTSDQAIYDFVNKYVVDRTIPGSKVRLDQFSVLDILSPFNRNKYGVAKLRSDLINQLSENVNRKIEYQFLKIVEEFHLLGHLSDIKNYSLISQFIFEKYKGRESKFERDFGFPMYLDGGLNNIQLEIDMLLSVIGSKFDGKSIKEIITDLRNGKNIFEYDKNIISDYLLDKGVISKQEDFVHEEIFNVKTDFKYENITQVIGDLLIKIDDELSKGNQLVFSLDGYKDLYRNSFRLNVNNDEYLVSNGSSFTILGISSDGRLIVDFNNQRGYIDLKQLLIFGNQFSIDSIHVEVNNLLDVKTEEVVGRIEEKKLTVDEFNKIFEDMDFDMGGFIIKGYEILEFISDREAIDKLLNNSVGIIFGDYTATDMMYCLVKLFQEYDKNGYDVLKMYPNVSEIYNEYKLAERKNLLSSDDLIRKYVSESIGSRIKTQGIKNNRGNKESIVGMKELVREKDESLTIDENMYASEDDGLSYGINPVVKSDIDYVIRTHNIRYYKNQDALDRLRRFSNPDDINYGNYNLITSAGNARNILMKYTPQQIRNYFNQLDVNSQKQSRIVNQQSDVLNNHNSRISSRRNFFEYIYYNSRNNITHSLGSLVKDFVLGDLNGSKLYGILVDFGSVMKKVPSKGSYVSYLNELRRLGCDIKAQSRDRNGNKDYERNQFNHVFSSNWGNIDPTQRLYFHAEYEDTFTFLKSFAVKCSERGLPFYFKTADFEFDGRRSFVAYQSSLTRTESAVIYSTDEYMMQYIEICNEIKNEHPEIKFYNPPIGLAVLDNWLGYGGQPDVNLCENKGVSASFNAVRARVLELSIKQGLKKFVNFYGSNIVSGNKTVDNLLIDSLFNYIVSVNRINNNSERNKLYEMLVLNKEFYLSQLKQDVSSIKVGNYVVRDVSKVRGYMYAAYCSDNEFILKLISDSMRDVCVEYDVDPDNFAFNLSDKKRMQMLNDKLRQHPNDVKVISDIKYIIESHDKKYFSGDALLRLKQFSDPRSNQYGNYNMISSNMGARNVLKKYTPKDIARYLSRFDGRMMSDRGYELKDGESLRNRMGIQFFANKGKSDIYRSSTFDENMYASEGDLINVNNNQLSASVNSFVKLDGRAVLNRILFTKESVNELFGSINESKYYSSQYSKEEVLFGLVKVFNEDSYYVSLFAENNPIASEFISLYYENKSSLTSDQTIYDFVNKYVVDRTIPGSKVRLDQFSVLDILSPFNRNKYGVNTLKNNLISHLSSKIDIVNKKVLYSVLRCIESSRVLTGISGYKKYSLISQYIFDMYKGQEGKFERDFGFPMYLDGGLNNIQLQLDMLISIHGKQFDGKSLKQILDDRNNGKISFEYDDKSVIIYLINRGIITNEEALVQETLFDTRKDFEYKNIKDVVNNLLIRIDELLSNGNKVMLSLSSETDVYGNMINIRDENGNIISRVLNGNSIIILGISSDGKLIVELSGRSGYIDLENELIFGRRFSIDSLHLEVNNLLEVGIEDKTLGMERLDLGNASFGEIEQEELKDLVKNEDGSLAIDENMYASEDGSSVGLLTDDIIESLYTFVSLYDRSLADLRMCVVKGNKRFISREYVDKINNVSVAQIRAYLRYRLSISIVEANKDFRLENVLFANNNYIDSNDGYIIFTPSKRVMIPTNYGYGLNVDIFEIFEMLYDNFDRSQYKGVADLAEDFGYVVINLNPKGNNIYSPKTISSNQYKMMEDFNQMIKDYVLKNDSTVGLTFDYKMLNNKDAYLIEYGEIDQALSKIYSKIDDNIDNPNDINLDVAVPNVVYSQVDVVEEEQIELSLDVDWSLNVKGAELGINRSEDGYLKFDDKILGISKVRQLLTDSLDRMSSYFGDAGKKVSSMYRKGFTTLEIFNLLKGDERDGFLSFLNNTRQGQFIKLLSDEEIKILFNWANPVSFLYKKINEELYSKKGLLKYIDDVPYDGEYSVKEIVKILDQAIDKYVIDEDIVLYRAITLDNLYDVPLFKYIVNQVGDISDIDLIGVLLDGFIGEKIDNYGYLSTSPSYTTSLSMNPDYAVVLQINTPAGTKGAYINQISSGYNYENEMLLARNTSLIIRDVSVGTDIYGNRKVFIKCDISYDNNTKYTDLGDLGLYDYTKTKVEDGSLRQFIVEDKDRFVVSRYSNLTRLGNLLNSAYNSDRGLNVIDKTGYFITLVDNDGNLILDKSGKVQEQFVLTDEFNRLYVKDKNNPDLYKFNKKYAVFVQITDNLILENGSKVIEEGSYVRFGKDVDYEVLSDFDFENKYNIVGNVVDNISRGSVGMDNNSLIDENMYASGDSELDYYDDSLFYIDDDVSIDENMYMKENSDLDYYDDSIFYINDDVMIDNN